MQKICWHPMRRNPLDYVGAPLHRYDGGDWTPVKLSQDMRGMYRIDYTRNGEPIAVDRLSNLAACTVLTEIDAIDAHTTEQEAT